MPISVLVIDNDKNTRDLLAKTMGRWGYRVDAVAKDKEGLLMAKHNDYEMVFTDLVCPGSSASEVIERIKNERPSTPVIVVTDHHSVG